MCLLTRFCRKIERVAEFVVKIGCGIHSWSTLIPALVGVDFVGEFSAGEEAPSGYKKWIALFWFARFLDRSASGQLQYLQVVWPLALPESTQYSQTLKIANLSEIISDPGYPTYQNFRFPDNFV